MVLLTGLLAVVFSTAVSLNVSCQIHEAGHALVGTLLGWSVERVHLCLPLGGGAFVEYSATPGPAWVNTVESFAGGLIAALFLIATYLLVFYHPRTPLRGPAWWGAGFGPMVHVGPQLFVSVAEGTTGPGQDYGEVLNANLAVVIPVVVAMMILGGAMHVWLWRSVWQRPPPQQVIDRGAGRDD